MSDVTILLHRFSAGDERALHALLPLVYEPLRALARRRMLAERASHTLDPTGLVHEAFEKLVGQGRAQLTNKAHFLRVASMAMRRILMNHARTKQTDKRGGQAMRVSLVDDVHATPTSSSRLFELDDAIEVLGRRNARQAEVVVCRVYGGMSHDEIATGLGVSEPTVRRDWRLAKAWLAKTLEPRNEGPPASDGPSFRSD